MPRFVAGEAFAKASKRKVKRRISMSSVGVEIEEALIWKSYRNYNSAI